MTPEQIETVRAWIVDLRSGNFAQISGCMRRERRRGEVEGFCCLGVLAERKLPRAALGYELPTYTDENVWRGRFIKSNCSSAKRRASPTWTRRCYITSNAPTNGRSAPTLALNSF